jgi:hypothetical protein
MKFFRSDTTAQEAQEQEVAVKDAPEPVATETLAYEAPLQPAEGTPEAATREPEPAKNAESGTATHAESASEAETDFEADLRDVVRRDVVRWRQPRPDHGRATDNVSSLVQRVAGQSVREIDNVIGELQVVRDILRAEGDRLRRDLNSYASINQSAMSSMKIIGESMAQWRSTLGKVRRA